MRSWHRYKSTDNHVYIFRGMRKPFKIYKVSASAVEFHKPAQENRRTYTPRDLYTTFLRDML